MWTGQLPESGASVRKYLPRFQATEAPFTDNWTTVVPALSDVLQLGGGSG